MFSSYVTGPLTCVLWLMSPGRIHMERETDDHEDDNENPVVP